MERKSFYCTMRESNCSTGTMFWKGNKKNSSKLSQTSMKLNKKQNAHFAKRQEKLR